MLHNTDTWLLASNMGVETPGFGKYIENWNSLSQEQQYVQLLNTKALETGMKKGKGKGISPEEKWEMFIFRLVGNLTTDLKEAT